jgi:preprotein translocase subunit SecD
MENKRNWKAYWTFGLLALAIMQLLPTFARYKDASGIEKSYLPDAYTAIFDRTLSYGLDLKGGLELRYTVDYKKAISDNTGRLLDSLQDRLGDAYAKTQKKDWATLGETEKKSVLDRFELKRERFNKIVVKFKNPADKALLDGEMVNTVDREFRLASEGADVVSLTMPDKHIIELKDKIVSQTLDVIRKRVDAFGLVEPDVRASGDADIDLQLPGLTGPQMSRIREHIGQAAQLTFRMVKPEAKVFDDKAAAVDEWKKGHAEEAKTLTLVPDGRGAYLKADHKSEILRFIKDLPLPPGVMIGYELVENREMNGKVGTTFWRTYAVEDRAELSGDNLTRANIGYAQQGRQEPVVHLEFNARGASILGEVSEKNVNNQMAIMLDDDVASAPQIKEKLGARVQITLGRGTGPNQMMEEAKALVTVLNNGAYKAPVIKVHDIEVGPSLGADAVKGGLVSMLVGVLLVVIFMVVYYRQGGMIANAALMLNLILQLACLVWFNAALTLPGMAGLTLTTAMAVDANILIFERIREELRAGRGVRNALDLGYGRAFWTIFDSHITAGMAGGVLMVYSSGPIYGFAVTLLIGIATSMFTSIVATRLVYDWMIQRGKIEQLSV